MSNEEIDNKISLRFRQTHSALMNQPTPQGEPTPQWALAAVIVLDQFSRNMFRGDKAAFAGDPSALKITKAAIAGEFDKTMSAQQRQFLYMPLMHSENLEDQDRCVELFTELGLQQHAIEHRDIVARFGRFPHRNAVLGRESTAVEIEYLKNAKRFGQ